MAQGGYKKVPIRLSYKALKPVVEGSSAPLFVVGAVSMPRFFILCMHTRRRSVVTRPRGEDMVISTDW